MELNGEYIIYYKNPNQSLHEDDYRRFVGKCENFTSGTCAFSNENNEMLIVRYKDIIQMRLKTVSK